MHDDHEHHKPLAGLLDGVNATFVGGPFAILPPANVAAIGAPGKGPVQTLVKFSADVAKKGEPLKLGRVPVVLTASAFGTGGTGPLVGIARWGSGNGSQQEMEFDLQLGFPLAATPGAAANGAYPTQGGQLFSVPATSLEIAARNDLNLIPGAGSIALGIILAPAVPSQATASIGIGNRAGVGGGLTRTIIARYNPGAMLAGQFLVPVPAFAKRFRVIRSSGLAAAAAITVNVVDGAFVICDGAYSEAAGVPPTTYTLPSAAAEVVVTVAAAGCDVVGCIFELGL